MKRLAAVVAIALWAAALAGQWQTTSHDHPAHPPHAVSAAIGSDSAAMMLDHPHVGDNAASHMPDGFTAAVLPRASVTPVALSVVAFIVGCAVLCGCAAVRAPRGPPDRHRIPLAGQALLIRICIARR
ncbi:putative copper homeostasis (lipo)protein LpqS [Mycolicibacterium lutetiense]